MLKTSPVRSVPLRMLLLFSETWVRLKLELLAASSPPAPTRIWVVQEPGYWAANAVPVALRLPLTASDVVRSRRRC